MSSPEGAQKFLTQGNWDFNRSGARLSPKHKGRRLDQPGQSQHIDPRRLARLRTRAQASTVAPVVMTSSAMTIFLHLIARAREAPTRKAPAALRFRCSGESPTWLAVRRTRFRAKQSTGNPVARERPCASMADWLNCRHHSREL
jgi:hypothetical protein